jgi:hypothetical protein
MAIKRAPRPVANFTVLTNEILRDSRLSFRARGILASILSRPDNWRSTAESLANESPEGRAAILTALKELENSGYLERKKYQDELGHWITESIIFDTPNKPKFDFPKSGKPKSDQPKSDNRTSIEKLIKKDLKETINASNVVAAYVDAYVLQNKEKPPTRSIGRIAKDAKKLLEEGMKESTLLDAATACATSGHANLVASYTWITTRQKESPASGWLKLLNDEINNEQG